MTPPSSGQVANCKALNFKFISIYGSMKRNMAEQSNTAVTVKTNSSLQTESETQKDTADEKQKETAFDPMLICESTLQAIPPNLQTIIENLSRYGGSPTNKHDLIICVLYVMMIETGFIPMQCQNMFNDNNIDFHKGRLNTINFLPEQWKIDRTRSYKFDFILQPFPAQVCKMCCVLLSDNLIVNFITDDISQYCMYLNVNRYVVLERVPIVPQKFRYLNDLSIKFKNQALVCKNDILIAEGVPHASIQGLPTEIVYQIFIHQKTKDFLNFKATCRRITQCAKFYEHELWEHFFNRDFYCAHASVHKWEDKYKTEFRLRNLKRRHEERRGRTAFDYYPENYYDII